MATSLLDGAGKVIWSSVYPPGFPEGVCGDRPVWELSYGEHAERIKQAFALVHGIGESQHGVFGFRSPMTGVTHDFDIRYEPVKEAAVVATWRKATAVSVLSDEERQILKLVCQDLSSKEIAGQLGVAESTVSNRRAVIRGKLGVKGTAGEVLKAIEMGLVRAPKSR